jgi:hypothetical protein
MPLLTRLEDFHFFAPLAVFSTSEVDSLQHYRASNSTPKVESEAAGKDWGLAGRPAPRTILAERRMNENESLMGMPQTTRTTPMRVGGIARVPSSLAAARLGVKPPYLFVCLSSIHYVHDEPVCDRCLLVCGLIGLWPPSIPKRSRSTRRSGGGPCLFP